MKPAVWIDTPGLEYVRKELVPDAAEVLKSEDSYEPVLLTGPTGTGKSYIKDLIRKRAGFKKREVLTVNCAAIHRNLIESELFGHEEGAFTGANKPYEGLLGTKGKRLLVLDEMGTLPRYVQAKLLILLDGREYRSVGSNKTKRTKMRILGITNSEPEKSFREDFLFRFLRIHVPGLHARRQDIPVLLKFFAPNVMWTKSDLLRLMAYNWPGNVRELRRFARLAEMHIEEIERGQAPGNSVLGWFYGLRGIHYSYSFPTAGVPILENPSAVEQHLRRVVPDALNRLQEFVPMFSLGDYFGSERIDLSELPESSHFWEREWEHWCTLFSQNPTLDKDLIRCLVEKRKTGLRWKTLDEFQDRKSERDFDDLGQTIDATWFQSSENSEVTCSEDRDGTESSQKIQGQPEFKSAFNIVAERMSPAKYKDAWIEHYLEHKPSEILSKHQDLSKSTLKNWLRNRRENQKQTEYG